MKAKKVLYLGLKPPNLTFFHYPVIQIVPREIGTHIKSCFQKLPLFSHVIFTSKSAVFLFFEIIKNLKLQIKKQKIIAIGEKTALYIRQKGFDCEVASTWTQEGVVQLLLQEKQVERIFWPKSHLSRNVLINYFEKMGLCYLAVDLYDTHLQKKEPIPNLLDFEEIIFTSPSCVEGFFNIFSKIPQSIKTTCIGPITTKALLSKLKI